MVINIGVVSDRRRGDMGARLADRVAANHLSVDDGTLGCTQNHASVWRKLATDPADWSVVLEDDALPVEDFRGQLVAALAVAPAPVVSLYLGRGYIDDRRTGGFVNRADLVDANWIVTPGRIQHAVALAVQADVLPDMIANLPTRDQPIDRSLSLWARRRGLQVAYTNPSLVDHSDGESLVTRYRRAERRAWRTGARSDWSDKMMVMV